MEKATPHCKLAIVKALIEAGKVRSTQSALVGAAAMGFNFDGIVAVIMALSELGQRNPAHLERLAKAVLERTPDIVNQLTAFGEQLGAKLKPGS